MADVLKDGCSTPQEGPGEPLAIECLPTVMEEIHAEVAEAFYSAPRGGVETGGVLYGVREKSRLLILAARPLGCEHAAGPSFVLSDHDRARLEDLLAAPRRDRNLAGMSVVGWYHSHTRSELDLTTQDLEIHDRYFPEPWQVALVLRPAAMRPTRLCFYHRLADGGLHSSAHYRESAPGRPVEMPRAPLPLPRTPAGLASAGGAGAAPAPAAAPATAPLVEPPGFLAVATPRRPKWRRWALVAVAVCAVAASAGYLTRDRWRGLSPAEPPPGLHLQVTDRQGQLEIRWDGTLALLREATGGSLELVDGSTRRFILLDPKLLRSGSVNYARQSDTVRIHLTVEKPDGSKVEELTSFLGQAPPGSPAAAAEQQAAEQAAAAERLRLENERQAALKRERDRELERKLEAKRRDEENKRLAAQKKTPPPAPPPAAAARPATQTAKAEPAPIKPEPAARAPAPPTPKVEPAAARPATQTVKAEPPPSQPAPPATKPVTQTAQAEPPPTKPEPATQTAKAQSPPIQPPPPASKPVTQTVKAEPPAAPKVEPAPAKPEALAAKPVPAAKPPAATPVPVSLAGEWSLSRSVASGSPFRPDVVTLSLTEDGGWVRGTLSGRYRAPRSSGAKPEVSFSFGGPVRSGNMKFPWAAADGSKGEIEFIRVPNNSESLEVVWYAADRKYVFNDVVVRTKKR
jgi:proteasome lid subunit RPN8/RPN11